MGTAEACHSVVALWVVGEDFAGEAGNAQDMHFQVRKTLTMGKPDPPSMDWATVT